MLTQKNISRGKTSAHSAARDQPAGAVRKRPDQESGSRLSRAEPFQLLQEASREKEPWLFQPECLCRESLRRRSTDNSQKKIVPV